MKIVAIAGLVVALVAGGLGWINLASINKVDTRVTTVDVRVTALAKDVAAMKKAVNARLDDLERRLNGNARQSGVRAGTSEDMLGVDHKRQAVHVGGFATASSEVTSAMQKFIDEGGYSADGRFVPGVPAMVADGWKPGFVACFADSRPYMVDGADRNPALADDRAANTAAYIAEKWRLKFDHAGRGATTKFGTYDLNRGCLLYYTK